MVSPTNLRENQRQSKIEISNEGPPGKASSTRMALAVEWRLVHVGNPRHAALLTQGTVSGPRHLFGGNAAQPAREHHLRLVVKPSRRRNLTRRGRHPPAGAQQAAWAGRGRQAFGPAPLPWQGVHGPGLKRGHHRKRM
jgi:hypothetical protein